MRNKGWTDDPVIRFEEADKRMIHLVNRRAELVKRNAPQDWLDEYDIMIADAIRDHGDWEGAAQDAMDARRRREYERMDIYGR